MNIVLPILSNLVIALILLTGAILGAKKGFLRTLLNVVYLAAGYVAGYFLAVPVASLVFSIPFIGELVKGVSLEAGIGIILSFMPIIAFIIFGILKLIEKIIIKIAHRNDVKPVKIRGIDRKTTRALRKEEKKLSRISRKKHSVASIIFGTITGLMAAIVVGFTIMVPVKHFTQETSVESLYTKSVYGIIEEPIEKVIGEF